VQALPAVAFKTLGQPRRRKPRDDNGGDGLVLTNDASAPVWFSKGASASAPSAPSVPSAAAAALSALAAELLGHVDASRYANVTEGAQVRGWADGPTDNQTADGLYDGGSGSGSGYDDDGQANGVEQAAASAAAAAASAVSEPTLEELFLKLDLNGDGTLDLEEVVGGAAKLALSPEAAGALFAKLDTAGRGQLSRATFEDGAKVGGCARKPQGRSSFSLPFLEHLV
jgi:hypothetical protein